MRSWWVVVVAWCSLMAVAFLVRTSSNQFWADTTTPGGEGAPPVRQTIPLRSIVCLTGGLGLRSLLQTKIYTTLPQVKPLPKWHVPCAWLWGHVRHPRSVPTTSHSSPDH